MNERMKACVPYVMKRLGLGLLIGGAVAIGIGQGVEAIRTGSDVADREASAIVRL